VVTPVRVSMVYPADATPGHLLSVVPSSQLALLQERERQLELARATARPGATLPAPPPELTIVPRLQTVDPDPTDGTRPLLPPPQILRPTPAPAWLNSPPPPPAINRRPMAPSPLVSPLRSGPGTSAPGTTLVDRYRQAVEAQQKMLRGWQDP